MSQTAYLLPIQRSTVAERWAFDVVAERGAFDVVEECEAFDVVAERGIFECTSTSSSDSMIIS
jgi:hypothetical protein